MTFEQFTALQPGDKIVNGDDIATVTQRTAAGVLIRWDASPGAVFPVSSAGTLWMHWRAVDAAPETT